MMQTGCGGETNEPQTEAEQEDQEVWEEDTDNDETIISILGEDKIVIKNEMLFGREAVLLDSRFTEENDTILHAIQGTWEIDEYMGFVPYDTYLLLIEEDLDEERRENYKEKYQEDKERAAADIPEYFFTIKGRGTEVEKRDDTNYYISVRNGNRTYASLYRCYIILSISQKGDEEYPVFGSRTLEGMRTDTEYPVIYIFFSTFYFSEEEEEIVYEPAFIALTADGQILFLKDGAFYSLKPSIQGEIMSGNFSWLEDVDWESKERAYLNMEESGKVEWRRIDLNKDGIEDLILQEKDTVGDSDQKRIYGIIACEKDGARCVKWNENDMTEYSFCGSTGELMYTAPYYGGVVSGEPYRHYYYDEEWNEITDYKLVVYKIDSLMDEEYAEKWKKEHPDMAEDGLYYRKYVGDEEEILTLEELKQIYETEMGDTFTSSFMN